MVGTLIGKTALVTGASRGIGRAIALRLAKEGALVAVHYGNNCAAAESAVAEITALGGQAFAIKADLSSLRDIYCLFNGLDAELTRRTGAVRFDILVNNAGIGLVGRVDDTTEEMFDRQFDINVKGLFFVTQQAASRLRDGGRVINISSLVALRAYPDCAAYAATKGAVNNLTMAFAGQFAARGITVNAVAPGMTATDFVAEYLKDETYLQMIRSATVHGRIGEPNDIAGIVACLVSPDAGWVTGQIVYATGGQQS